MFRHITADMLKKLLPMPAKKDDENLLVMVCGPPGFMKLISGEKTKDNKQVFLFRKCQNDYLLRKKLFENFLRSKSKQCSLI